MSVCEMRRCEMSVCEMRRSRRKEEAAGAELKTKTHTKMWGKNDWANAGQGDAWGVKNGSETC